MADLEQGMKWWVRYLLVPLIGGGGLVAVVIALLKPAAWVSPPVSNEAPVKE